jgi:hypothetical protein
MKISFDASAKEDEHIRSIVNSFLSKFPTLESAHEAPIIIFQDGLNGSYYIKGSIQASNICAFLDLNAKLSVDDTKSFRANRELLLSHKTFTKMRDDALAGREFNDIIVEYNTEYEKDKPLKIWGGQHRSKAIIEAASKTDRYHGFRIFFNLDKHQRTELALISNTNISVSNDTFDRMLEETMFGNKLRLFVKNIGFLKQNEDFPDVGSVSDKISVKLARNFIVNFYLGKDQSAKFSPENIDKNYYDPYCVETGVVIDEKYQEIMKIKGDKILSDASLLEAGKAFFKLHIVQCDSVKDSKSSIPNRKSFRNKAFVESVLCGWAFVAGLLQGDKVRLKNHFSLPQTNKKIPDPLNAQEMSQFRHQSDPPTYRGLGTRSSPKDRQRIAQLFLLKSLSKSSIIDKKLMDRAVSQVVGLQTLKMGYTTP